MRNRINLRFTNLQFTIWLRIVELCLCAVMAACSSDETSSSHSTTHTLKVAVIMESGEQARWQRTSRWALENIADAQRGMADKVELQLTFKSQDDADLNHYIQQLAEDTTVAAIIGPTTSACAEQMAAALGSEMACIKPMLTPSATHVEYQRKYSALPYVWNMAESDIAQLEVLLSGIASTFYKDTSPVMLLCADDGNGEARNAYAEWFGFIAEEYGLKVDGVYLYSDEASLRRYVRDICGNDWHMGSKYLLFNPSSTEMALALDDEIGKMKGEVPEGKLFYTPSIVCSDAFVAPQIASSAKNATYEGVDLYASPESGFIQAYHQRFGEELVNGEAQFYDAICLIAYAAKLQLAYSEGLSPLQGSGERVFLNDALLAVVDGRDGSGSSWLAADMRRNFELLSQGRTPDLNGVSGSLTFDQKTHASVCASTFRRWRLYEGQFLTTEYLTTEGSLRTTSSKNTWDWTASRMQSFSVDDASAVVTYPPLDDRWALLIAASKGWPNYRFQADVFAMYQLLRRHGFDDDHIVLICEDDVANHAKNPHPGELRVSDNGPNLYEHAAIDYRLSDLYVDDLADILQGRQSERLPEVLHPDDDDNVLIFWSSHGTPGALYFGTSPLMTNSRMRNILAETPHRKMLVTVEACYSGGLGVACQGMPGCLFITAANQYETSHADVWSEDCGVFLSNGFTRGFQEAIDQNPAISLRDLYYNIARNTSGSHVKVYNATNFGSVYSNTMAEFLR